jgi:hypothetical protein
MALDLSTVKEKLGPLPIWVWGVLVGGGILGVMYVINARNANAETAQNASTSSGGDLYAGINDNTVANNIAAGLENESYETNDSWINKAVRFLATQGYSESEALLTLQNFLGGLPIVGSNGRAQIDLVLGRFGTPPDGVAGIPTYVPDAPVSTKTVSKWVRSRQTKNIYVIYTDSTYAPVTSAQWKAAMSPALTYMNGSSISKNRKRVPYVAPNGK